MKAYGPTTKRLTLGAEKLGKDPTEFIDAQKKTWDSNYEKGCEVLDTYLRKRHGVGYKEVTRADVPVKLK